VQLTFLSCGQQNGSGIQGYELPAKVKLDTIMLPGGFYIGMTENEVRDLVAANKKTFFTHPNQLLKYLHMKLDGIDYNISMDLYRGKLNTIMYLGNTNWTNIEDPKLKSHFNVVFNLLEGMNNYPIIENNYKDKYDVEWPYSLIPGSNVTMSTFRTDNELTGNGIQLSLVNFKGQLSIDISYYGEKDQSDSSLSKSLYFD
jgi:hypothetical protein